MYINNGIGSLRAPYVQLLLLFCFSPPYTFYSTPIAPVPTTSRQRSRALRHSECYSNIHAQETNYSNTRGVRDPSTITKAKQGNAGSHRQGHCRADPLFWCSAAGTPGFTPTYGYETFLLACHACLPLSSPFCFISFLLILPFSPPFIPRGRGRSS